MRRACHEICVDTCKPVPKSAHHGCVYGYLRVVLKGRFAPVCASSVQRELSNTSASLSLYICSCISCYCELLLLL